MLYPRHRSQDNGLLHTLLAGLVVGIVNVFQSRYQPDWETETYNNQLVDDPYDEGAGFDYEPPLGSTDDG
jgi:hypothetical protein